jgi:uncharacterized protein
MFKHMNFIDWTALTLLIIGGLNWGLVGIAHYDVVASLLGSFARFVYIAVGLAAAYTTFLVVKGLAE